MSQNESTPFLVTDAKNLTLIDATRENSPWCRPPVTKGYYVYLALFAIDIDYDYDAEIF